jgi:predicted MFS family arabinose efflux permease
MMDRCSPGSEGADYTVQASAVVIATGAASAASGFLAERLGYPLHFTAAAGLSLAALLVVGAAVEPRTPGDRP